MRSFNLIALAASVAGAVDLSGGITRPVGWTKIQHKPVPLWPDRRSYRTQVREARRRRNVSKRGGAR